MADTPTPSDVTSLQIAGVDVDLASVLYALTYNHGRADVADQGSASSCTLTLQAPGLVLDSAQVGNTLTVEVVGLPAFAGDITDVVLTHPTVAAGDPVVAQYDLTAAGVLARSGVAPVGVDTWPTETAHDRALRVLADTALPAVVQGGGALSVLARDPDPTDALTALGELAADTGAALVDTPAGAVLLQYLDARSIGTVFTSWAQVVGSWAAFVGSWALVVEPVATPLLIPAGAVAFEPEWSSRLGGVVNDVSLSYGIAPDAGTQPTYTADDPVSVAARGRRHYGASTKLADLESAVWRTQLILSRQAEPRWTLGGVSVLMYLLNEWTKAAVVALQIGDRVALESLPDPAPTAPGFLVVEGWQDSHTPGSGYVRTFSLSDPRMSFAVVTWQGLVTNPVTWAQAQGTWVDLMTATDLTRAYAGYGYGPYGSGNYGTS